MLCLKYLEFIYLYLKLYSFLKNKISSVKFAVNPTEGKTNQNIDTTKLMQMRKTESKKLLRSIFINIVFLYVLYSAFYSNRDENKNAYVEHIKSIFTQHQTVNFIKLIFSIKLNKSIKFFF